MKKKRNELGLQMIWTHFCTFTRDWEILCLAGEREKKCLGERVDSPVFGCAPPPFVHSECITKLLCNPEL